MKWSVSRFLTKRKQKIISAIQEFKLKHVIPQLRWIGLDAFLLKPAHHYVPDYFGRAAHKQEDIRRIPLFGELAEEVIRTGRTTLYYDRLYTIYQSLLYLKTVVQPQQHINLVEIGVYKGGTSFFIASLANSLGLIATHHSFDTFEGHAEEDVDPNIEVKHRPKSFSGTSYDDVKKVLCVLENVILYKGRFQDNCHNLDNQKVHFAHIDMDIYIPTFFALKFLEQNLARGGIMIVDDYGFTTCPGIKKAIEEFRALYPHYFGTPLLTGQYLLIRLID